MSQTRAKKLKRDHARDSKLSLTGTVIVFTVEVNVCAIQECAKASKLLRHARLVQLKVRIDETRLITSSQARQAWAWPLFMKLSSN